MAHSNEIFVCVIKLGIFFILDFEIQMDHLIPVRRQDLVSINKRKVPYLEDSTVPVVGRVKKKKSEKIDKYLNFARELNRL